jgi:hypothetical protein
MITIYSPRIQNLGDFSHCLPALSGFVKTYGKVSFGICPRMKRFKGLIDMLMYQGLFTDVFFMDERNNVDQYIIIDDSGSDNGNTGESLVSRRFYNFIRKHYPELPFDFDSEFELKVPDSVYTDHLSNRVIVGDRWSPSDAPDVDDRRASNITQPYDEFKSPEYFYLDYSNDLITNLSIIKYNSKSFITTFTGIGILADLMNKETVVLWDDDMRMWQGKPVTDDYRLHYWTNRKSKLQYVKDFNLFVI